MAAHESFSCPLSGGTPIYDTMSAACFTEGRDYAGLALTVCVSSGVRPWYERFVESTCHSLSAFIAFLLLLEIHARKHQVDREYYCASFGPERFLTRGGGYLGSE